MPSYTSGKKAQNKIQCLLDFEKTLELQEGGIYSEQELPIPPVIKTPAEGQTTWKVSQPQGLCRAQRRAQEVEPSCGRETGRKDGWPWERVAAQQTHGRALVVLQKGGLWPAAEQHRRGKALMQGTLKPRISVLALRKKSKLVVE